MKAIVWDSDYYPKQSSITSPEFDTSDAISNRVMVKIYGDMVLGDTLEIYNNGNVIHVIDDKAVLNEVLYVLNPNKLKAKLISVHDDNTSSGITVIVKDAIPSEECTVVGSTSMDELLQQPTVDIFGHIIERLCSIGDGASAYQIALNHGYVGTQSEWIESLKVVGDSAYQVAVDNGFNGTVDEWILSLKGDKGDKGDDGEVDYDVLLEELLNDEAFIEAITVTITEVVAKRMVIRLDNKNIVCVKATTHIGSYNLCNKQLDVTVVNDKLKAIINKDAIMIKIKEVTT